MPTTLRNTDILFNDGSTQSTAAAAMNTTNVLNATAGASVGAVGTYAFLSFQDATNSPAVGATAAGSLLRYTSSTQATNTAPAGTWRQMGATFSASGYAILLSSRVTVWLRIS